MSPEPTQTEGAFKRKTSAILMFDIRESAESSAVGHQCHLPAQLDFHVLLELKQRLFVIFWDALYHYKCSFNKKEIKMS